MKADAGTKYCEADKCVSGGTDATMCCEACSVATDSAPCVADSRGDRCVWNSTDSRCDNRTKCNLATCGTDMTNDTTKFCAGSACVDATDKATCCKPDKCSTFTCSTTHEADTTKATTACTDDAPCTDAVCCKKKAAAESNVSTKSIMFAFAAAIINFIF